MASNTKLQPPPFRKLKGYAFDPSLSLKLDTAFINNMVYKVPWETLTPGPCGEYLEVMDFDPTTKQFYLAAELDNAYLLAQDGHEPSESNPQFHQQMVYAVAMTTIKNFENALGRQVFWSARNAKGKDSKGKEIDDFVPKLRIYPHAFRDANAYYSPDKKALLFGYFSATPANETLQMPGSLVFTCLSHDIIAHETTHAILDGMFSRYIEGTNPDVLAFHEAFSDIVALFQHFTFADVLKNQIAKTRGSLDEQNILGQLAQQFGTAVGSYGALRDAIGFIGDDKQWHYKEPNGEEYQTVFEPHARGSILVSAVFEAFLTIYKNRVADLLRIATNGSGILPQGELQQDLVNRLADEAAKSASHVLKMCIRALDYCPPTDITFGDYLRAIITADVDLVPDDRQYYRLAFIDAFRKRGIYPAGVRNLSIESLCYQEIDNSPFNGLFGILTDSLRSYRKDISYEKSRRRLFEITRDYVAGSDREMGLHKRLFTKFLDSPEFENLTGLVMSGGWRELGIRTSDAYNQKIPSLEVHSLKLASRSGPGNIQRNQIILTLMQRADIAKVTNKTVTPVNGDASPLDKDHFVMRGGCTLIFDLDTLELKYAISKPLLDMRALKDNKYRIDHSRALSIFNYLNDSPVHNDYTAYFSQKDHPSGNEPFAFLHNH
ncbi:MAG TPA: hypothetical protein VK528_06740 [Flavobacterium sp.]|nr:hypothetical protein [Flavobacterium sp.]